jgi:hypothetical protein
MSDLDNRGVDRRALLRGAVAGAIVGGPFAGFVAGPAHAEPSSREN